MQFIEQVKQWKRKSRATTENASENTAHQKFTTYIAVLKARCTAMRRLAPLLARRATILWHPRGLMGGYVYFCVGKGGDWKITPPIEM